MNILFHMFLSGDDPELLVGNFMGDFVKGRLDDSYPSRVRQGLILHRRIDSFAQQDAGFQASRLRLPAEYGLYRGVLVDLFYDHFLARGWEQRSASGLADYLAQVRQIIDAYRPIMPPRLQELIPVMFAELLPSYCTVAGIESALQRMSIRVKRANPLARGGTELTHHYAALETDFERFLPAVRDFVGGIIASDGLR